MATKKTKKPKKPQKTFTCIAIGKDGLIGAEAHEITSANGLMKMGVRFGMTKDPDREGGGGAREVQEAFRDLAKQLHNFADGLDGAMRSAALAVEDLRKQGEPS